MISRFFFGPHHHIDVCLKGDINSVKQLIKDNLRKSMRYKLKAVIRNNRLLIYQPNSSFQLVPRFEGRLDIESESVRIIGRMTVAKPVLIFVIFWLLVWPVSLGSQLVTGQLKNTDWFQVLFPVFGLFLALLISYTFFRPWAYNVVNCIKGSRLEE